MRLAIIIISLFIIPTVVVAQDFHFTQYDRIL